MNNADVKSTDQLDNESQKEYITRLVAMVAEERLHPKSDDPFGPIDYFASLIYAHEHPGQITVQWWALREEMKEEYRAKSKQMIASWALDQIMKSKG